MKRKFLQLSAVCLLVTFYACSNGDGGKNDPNDPKKPQTSKISEATLPAEDTLLLKSK